MQGISCRVDNNRRREVIPHKKVRRRELEFKVVDVECSKCSRKMEGSFYMDMNTLAYSGAFGFTVYKDGVICIYCQGS